MFFKKLLIFVVVMCTICFLYLQFSAVTISNIKGPSTKVQIDKSFSNSKTQNYTTLILGSSKVYRGINPDIFDSSYNFAHDNDIFNQMYFKLKYLLAENRKIDNLIVGYDYFSFSYLSDTRNYVYKKYFTKEYLKDYEKNILRTGLKELNNNFNDFVTLNFTSTFKPFIQGFYTRNPKRPILTQKGQLKRFEIGGDFSNAIIHDKADILPIQLEYFDKLIAICEENSISVFLVMLPTTEFELKKYSVFQKNKIDSIAQVAVNSYKRTYYLKYENSNIVSNEDFEDAIHLNTWGADKFTTLLKKDIYLKLNN